MLTSITPVLFILAIIFGWYRQTTAKVLIRALPVVVGIPLFNYAVMLIGLQEGMNSLNIPLAENVIEGYPVWITVWAVAVFVPYVALWIVVVFSAVMSYLNGHIESWGKYVDSITGRKWPKSLS